MPQEFAHAHSENEQESDERPISSAQSQEARRGDDDVLDDVLDDIESTLAANAEEYVSSFVQKGGQ